jgi:hypothetical protein
MLALRELFEGLEVPEEELDFKVESRSDGTYWGEVLNRIHGVERYAIYK